MVENLGTFYTLAKRPHWTKVASEATTQDFFKAFGEPMYDEEAAVTAFHKAMMRPDLELALFVIHPAQAPKRIK